MGEESFEIKTAQGKDLLWVARIKHSFKTTVVKGGPSTIGFINKKGSYMNLLEKAEQGFDLLLTIDEPTKQKVLVNLDKWLSDPGYADYLPQLEDLIAQGKWDFLLDSFYQIIPFGTGGRRGPVGIGENRINSMTISNSIQGHSNYLKENRPDKELKIVIANDVRIFNDIRENYNPDLKNPLIGISSRDFSKAAAGVYAANGITVYMADDEVGICSTPELSFYIRHYEADGGLNISASHNHPDDNGAKFYNFQGGQEIPPNDQEMSDMVDRVDEVKTLNFEEAVEKGLVVFIEEAAHRAYIESNLKIPLTSTNRSSIKIVYSPLNGTGTNTCGYLLEAAGFNLIKVEKQYLPDGSFKNVKFRIANPEVRESMEEAIRVAKEAKAHLAVSTDPDADRIGICAPNQEGEWLFFTGNEIGIMLANYLLEQKKGTRGDKSFVAITRVTSQLICKIAEAYGVSCIDNLLVGFKYIGNLMYQMETKGEFQGIKGNLDGFVLGAEESHGILVNPDIRDKDAAGAALVLADLAAVLVEQGKTLPQYLDEIYKKYGYVNNLLVCTIMEGAVGTKKIKHIQAALRLPENRFKEIAGNGVVEFIDQLDEDKFGKILSLTDQASRDLLIYKLKNKVTISLRPSGTEPKNKIYYEIFMDPLGEQASDEELETQKAEAERILKETAHDFTNQMLGSIGIEISPFSLKVSDLVSLENKKDFVENFLPELLKKVAENDFDPGKVRKWIENRLKSYGQDPRYLVKDALEAFLNNRNSTDSQVEIKRRIEQAFWG